MGRIILLHEGDHRGEFMGPPVMTKFKPLDPTGGAGFGNHLFTLIAVLFPGRGETFAFDGEEGIELSVPSAFNDEHRRTRLGSKINFPPGLGFIAGFRAELNVAPILRIMGGAIEMIAEMLGQSRLRLFVRAVRVVPPAGKFLSDKFHEFTPGSGWKVNLRVETA